ncbi:hypothetical protein N7475_002803 [Penicillium sp. IBT 31633x]|nr:hypothetical protein N7475_002803 [Penicillium sp. IBT 31633x]
MTLLALPTETLWTIASYLRRQRDIFALIQTNRHLYKTLIGFLYSFHGQYKHGIALSFAAERGLLVPLENLLHGLKVSRNWPKKYENDEDDEDDEDDKNAKGDKDAKDEETDEVDEDEEETVPRIRKRHNERWRFIDMESQDIFTHPLYHQGYSIQSIMNIQHALVVAIQGGHTEIVTVLLDFGAQVNFYCGPKTKWTSSYWLVKNIDYPPLFIAVRVGNLELVRLLLQRGAAPEAYTPSPLYRAVEEDRRDIIPILLEYGVGPQATALKLAVRNDDESMVRFLVDRGFNVPQYGYAALYIAKIRENWDIFNLLESRGATLAAISDIDKADWAHDDGDGTLVYVSQMTCCYDDPGVDDSEDELKGDAEAGPETGPEAGPEPAIELDDEARVIIETLDQDLD